MREADVLEATDYVAPCFEIVDSIPPSPPGSQAFLILFRWSWSAMGRQMAEEAQ